MKRYALVGTGSRALDMFALPLTGDLKDVASLVGLYDVNPLRAAVVAAKAGGVKRFEGFDAMLHATRPDTVIVCTKDSVHHEYIVKALEAGCDVISEKPMTIDAPRCRRILEAEHRTGRNVTVIFNDRSLPFAERIKELVSRGDIGTILSADFEWILDTSHGADYFRRWHRRLENSGGLLVHKATHHFDIVNWWLGEDPVTVYANGSRRFYGDDRRPHGERCSSCSYASSCELFLDLRADPAMVELYLDTESADGYWRDRCVFDAGIDIMDSMSLSVRYSGGALLTYSLVAHSPWEGWRIALSGTAGRLEAEQFSSGPHARAGLDEIRVYDRRGNLATHRVARAEGTHGGADERLRRRLFRGDLADPLGQVAGSRAGAMSLLIGAAANLSIATGKPVDIPELLGTRL
jgi:predicted dehydrogenase